MRPKVIVHNEVSLDGRIDFYAGNIGLYYDIAGRLGADATLTGADTLIAGLEQFRDESAESPDDASADGAHGARPPLVVVDARGRIDRWPMLKNQPYWGEVLVLCSGSTPRGYLEELEALGIEYIVRGDRRVDLPAALEELARRRPIKVLRVDGGGSLTGALLRAGLVDEVSLLVDPCLIGGESPASLFRAPDLESAGQVTRLALTGMERLPGDIVWLRYLTLPQPALYSQQADSSGVERFV